MNKFLLIFFFVVFGFGIIFLGSYGGYFSAIKGTKFGSCTTIQSGNIIGSDGVVEIGFNEWGYNYQGRVFNGMYCDYHPIYRPGGAQYDWCMENYSDVKLAMKWNDAWLDNRSCDGDTALDRHFGYPSYIGSGAWLTNHMSGEYVENGRKCTWNYFVKIVAKPTSDYVCEEGEIWGEFCEIMAVENDSCAGLHGLQFKAARPGLGNWEE